MRRQKRNKIWMGMLQLLLAGIVLSGCGSTGKENEIHIGYFNNVTHAQALYMKSQGKLEEKFGEDVRVLWTAFNAGPAEVEALFSGQIDIGYIGPVPAITANVRSNGDITILSGATMAGAELVTSKDSGIRSVRDLDGKTVAIPSIGNTQHLCLLKLLSDHDLKTVENGGTVTVTAVENADVQNMMEFRNIDAALVPEPWGTTLEAAGAEIVLDYDEVYQEGDYPVAVVVVQNEFLKEHPKQVEQFLKAHQEATSYISTHTKEAASVIHEEMESATGKSLGEDVLAEAFSKIVFETQVNEKAIYEFGEICREQGFIAKSYDNIFADFPID